MNSAENDTLQRITTRLALAALLAFALGASRPAAADGYTVTDLGELITDAWRCLAPRSLVNDFDARG